MIRPERGACLVLQLVGGLFLAAVGFVIADLHRRIVELAPGGAAPSSLYLVWAGYALTVGIFAWAARSNA